MKTAETFGSLNPPIPRCGAGDFSNFAFELSLGPPVLGG